MCTNSGGFDPLEAALLKCIGLANAGAMHQGDGPLRFEKFGTVILESDFTSDELVIYDKVNDDWLSVTEMLERVPAYEAYFARKALALN